MAKNGGQNSGPILRKFWEIEVWKNSFLTINWRTDVYFPGAFNLSIQQPIYNFYVMWLTLSRMLAV